MSLQTGGEDRKASSLCASTMKRGRPLPSVREQMDDMKTSCRKRFKAEELVELDKYMESLGKTNIEAKAVRAGEQLPDMVLTSYSGKSIRLFDALKEAPAVIFFDRGTWCPACQLFLRILQEAMPEFNSLSINVFAVLPQSPQSLKDPPDNLQLIYDPDCQLADAFRLTYSMPLHLLQFFGDFSPFFAPFKEFRVPMPACYLIDQTGKVAYAHVDLDPYRRSELEELFAALCKLMTLERGSEVGCGEIDLGDEINVVIDQPNAVIAEPIQSSSSHTACGGSRPAELIAD